MLGRLCCTIGADPHFVSFSSGSSSRSSREKSKSWVEMGGSVSIDGGDTIAGGLTGSSTVGTTSEASSREICVLLSRKSSQQSVGGSGRYRLSFATDLDSIVIEEFDLDAGSPGSLKPGFTFAAGFALTTGRVGFLNGPAGGTRPGIEGSLNPVCDVSRGVLDGV